MSADANCGLVEQFKDLGVDIVMVQYRDGQLARVQITYKDAAAFAYNMREARNEQTGLKLMLDAANERLARLAKRGDVTTHLLDPEQLERLGEIFSPPTRRERQLEAEVDRLNRHRGNY